MILFSSTKLERKLADETISQWEKAKYILILFVLFGLTAPIYIITPCFKSEAPTSAWLIGLISIPLTIVVTYMGIKKCYHANEFISNTDFIERFVPLFVTLTLKFTLIILPFSFLLNFILTSYDVKTIADIDIYLTYSILPIMTYIFYIFLTRSFHRLGKLIKNRIMVAQ